MILDLIEWALRRWRWIGTTVCCALLALLLIAPDLYRRTVTAGASWLFRRVCVERVEPYARALLDGLDRLPSGARARPTTTTRPRTMTRHPRLCDIPARSPTTTTEPAPPLGRPPAAPDG